MWLMKVLQPFLLYIIDKDITVQYTVLSRGSIVYSTALLQRKKKTKDTNETPTDFWPKNLGIRSAHATTWKTETAVEKRKL